MGMDTESDGERGVPVSQAAKVLGISTAAARKRVQRGSLRAYKVDGQWFVVLPASGEAGQDVGRTSDAGQGYDVARDTAVAYFQREHDRLLTLVEEQQRAIDNLTEAVAELARKVGRPSPSPMEALSARDDPSPEREGDRDQAAETPATPPQRRSWLSRLFRSGRP
jgi:hypothetical protein